MFYSLYAAFKVFALSPCPISYYLKIFKFIAYSDEKGCLASIISSCCPKVNTIVGTSAFACLS